MSTVPDADRPRAPDDRRPPGAGEAHAPPPDPTRLRPSRRIHLSVSREEAIAAVRAAVDSAACRETASGTGRWCEIHLPEEEQRIWTPHLSIRADHEPEGSSLFTRFAPRTEVWTFFVFLYASIAFLTVFGGILGYVQAVSGEPAWGFWALWLGIPALLALHLVSYVGQRLAREQSAALQRRLDAILATLPVQGDEDA
ncbi:MAG TPA: hypothetical protein VK858_17335 [Longimicrobiales bacterium]|nr:hypothetical protein [Longimicrobiales bacterium]